jgi:hypothetical protein
MSSITHWLIVAAAFIVATVLLCLGIRRLGLDRQKCPSLFSMAIMFFLMAYGTAPAAPPGKGEAAAPTTLQATKATRVKDNSTASKLPPELASPKKWAEFKALWNKLNAVNPKPATDQPNARKSYSRTITAQQAQAWQKELAHCLGMENINQVYTSITRTRLNLGGAKWTGNANVKVLSVPSLVLANIVRARVQYMQRGLPMMTCRMAPTPSMRFKDTLLLEDIEKRIDILNVLRKKGIVGDEFITAHRTLQNDIYLHAVLTTFDGSGWYRVEPVAEPARRPVTMTTARMAMPAPKPPTDMQKKLGIIKLRIEKLKTLKEDGKIKDPEYATAMNKLQQEKRDLVRFDPEAWIRGYEKFVTAQQSRQQGVKAEVQQKYLRTTKTLNKLKEAQSQINNVVTKLETP